MHEPAGPSTWPTASGRQGAARHADPRTTTIYDHRRQSFDRHAAYVVVAFVRRLVVGPGVASHIHL